MFQRYLNWGESVSSLARRRRHVAHMRIAAAAERLEPCQMLPLAFV